MLLLILLHMSIIRTLSASTLFNLDSPLRNNFAKRESDQPKFPRFLKVPTFVQTYEGADVILSCGVENLADRLVFWIRNKDLQILTAGLLTFSSDTRFKVNHENSVDENDWSLLITKVKTQDTGFYECQLNTDPKMKLNINLLVRQSKEYEEMMEMDSPFHQEAKQSINIEGENSKGLKEGETILLTCRVFGIMYENNSQKCIEWLKNEKSLNFKTRSEGSVTTINTIWTESGDGISYLTLAMLKSNDEGRYSCSSKGHISEAILIQVAYLKDQNESNSTRVQAFVFKFFPFKILILEYITLQFYYISLLKNKIN